MGAVNYTYYAYFPIIGRILADIRPIVALPILAPPIALSSIILPACYIASPY